MTQEIADRLTQIRKEKGMSQEELAEKLGVSRQAVSKWERAESAPDTDNLIALAKLYGVTLDELLNADTEPDRPAAPEDDPIDPETPLPKGSYFDHVTEKKRRAFPDPGADVVPARLWAQPAQAAGQPDHGDDHLPAAGP